MFNLQKAPLENVPLKDVIAQEIEETNLYFPFNILVKKSIDKSILSTVSNYPVVSCICNFIITNIIFFHNIIYLLKSGQYRLHYKKQVYRLCKNKK